MILAENKSLAQINTCSFLADKTYQVTENKYCEPGNFTS